MRYKLPRPFYTLCLFAAIMLQGCAPTYFTQEEMIESVKHLCKKEYKADVKAAIVGKTMGVYMPIKGLFDLKTMQLSAKAFEKADGVMLSVSRVALSGSREINFYTVVTADKDVPGAEVAITRYVKDLRRFMHRDISRGEFGKRVVVDVRFNPQAIIDKWSGGFTVDDLTMENFICQQASRRITDAFTIDPKLAGRFKVTECAGSLQDKAFVFNVDISREGLPMSELIHGKAWHDEVLNLCAKTIAHVVWAYSYEDFDKITIVNKFDSKILVIEKIEASKYRKRRVNIE